jgi:uncharacterized protein with ATP-grasp and redox domains
MKAFLDCMPCLIKRALNAARIATTDPHVHEEVLRQALRIAARLPFTTSPVLLGREVQRIVCEKSGNPDPYRQVKERFNREALALYDRLKTQVRESEHPFETAVRLAIAGNIIDFGPASRPEDIRLEETIEDTLTRELAVNDMSRMRENVGLAKRILYLTDNAGEIVLDRILIEELPMERTTVAVRGEPIINDATMEDAETAGLTDLMEVIDNGSDAPGTILETCSDGFRRRFDEADLVIAKGLGNYETLSDLDGRNLCFLFKAKCPVLAEELGCRQGDIIVKCLG